MKMRIGGYDRDVRHRGDGLEAVRIRWPPGTRTPKHNHHSGGCVWVLAGRVFEIQDGRKAYYAEGESFLEVPGGLVHIVGNDSSTDAITFHVYRPELVMELFSDSEADLAALHGTAI